MSTPEEKKPSAVALARRGEEEEKVVNLAAGEFDRSKVNLLVPTDKVRMISPYHMARMQVVRVSPNPEDGDVFKVGSRKSKAGQWEDILCPSKVMLMKLSDAAGIIWNTSECKRLDNMTNRDYVAFQAVGGIRLPDGSFRAFKASKEIDMEVLEAEIRELQEEKGRKGNLNEAEVEKKIKSEVIQKRKHKAALCETGAYKRVITALLSLKSQYTPAELAKPFVVARIDFAPDYSDPEIKRKVEISVLSQMQTDFVTPRECLPVSLEEGRQAEHEVREMRKAEKPDWNQAEEGVIVDEVTGEIEEVEPEEIEDEGEPSGGPSRTELLELVESMAENKKWNAQKLKLHLQAKMEVNSLDELDKQGLANFVAKCTED